MLLVSELQASQERIFRLQFFEEENQKLRKNIIKIENQLRQDLRRVEKNIREYINDELLEAENDCIFKINSVSAIFSSLYLKNDYAAIS